MGGAGGGAERELLLVLMERSVNSKNDNVNDTCTGADL